MKYLKWICGMVILLGGIPMFLEFFIFRNEFPSALSNAEWASFLGSFLGGIISLIGIFITIQFTQNENRKERELLYKPYIRVTECEPSGEPLYIPIFTKGTYIVDGVECNVGIKVRNVGFGPILDLKIHSFEYCPSDKSKAIPIKITNEKGMFFAKDETFEVVLNINLGVNNDELSNIEPDDDITKILPFMKYGGDLIFKITGYDLCEKIVEKNVKVHVSSQIAEVTKGVLKYVPEAHLT